MDYLKVSDAGTAPLHPAAPQSVAVDYGRVVQARTCALQAFSAVERPSGSTEERLADREGSVQALGEAVLALVGVITEVVSGLDQRDVHVVNYPAEQTFGRASATAS